MAKCEYRRRVGGGERERDMEGEKWLAHDRKKKYTKEGVEADKMRGQQKRTDFH